MKVLAFGIVKDIFENSMIDLDMEEAATTDDLKILLEQKYPQLTQLGSYMIAVNSEYALGTVVIHDGDEVAVIPPVSGG